MDETCIGSKEIANVAFCLEIPTTLINLLYRQVFGRGWTNTSLMLFVVTNLGEVAVSIMISQRAEFQNGVL